MNDIEKAAQKWKVAAQQANNAIAWMRVETSKMPHIPTNDPDFYIEDIRAGWQIVDYHQKKLSIALDDLTAAANDMRRNTENR